MLINLMACFGYMTEYEFFYHNYELLINSINITELIVLIAKAPWNGIVDRCRKLLHYAYNFRPRGNWYLEIH